MPFLAELDSKDADIAQSSGGNAHISTPFAAANISPDDRRRLHGGKRHNGALSWSQRGTDGDVAMLDSIDESSGADEQEPDGAVF